MTENVEAVVREPEMSGDLEGSSPAKKKQPVRRWKTAPGRQELYGRPPENTQSSARERTTITTHAVAHKEPSSPRKQEENRRRKTAPGRQELYGRPAEDTQSNVRERTTITTHAVVSRKEPSSPRKEGAKSTQTAVQISSSPRQDDELDQLYESRKATGMLIFQLPQQHD